VIDTERDLDFDPDELRERYRVERDRRIRPEGNAQYVDLAADFGYYADDPHAEEFTREPLYDEVGTLIIGGGFGGLLAGARLRQAGVEDIRIVEKGGDFGGTWYWNRYPGVRCDIEAYIYLPLLEELGYLPSEKYATGEEILRHAQAVARKFDLYRDVCFQTEITQMTWDDTDRRWTVLTDRSDVMKARNVVISAGPFDRPKLPRIPGIADFAGHTFHTSRWDYRYTGDDLGKLADKRVAVIGTGATAIQCVPALAEHAQHLYVVQRTPSSVDERNNRPTEPDWPTPPGWHQRRRDNFIAILGGVPQDDNLVGDKWTELPRTLVALRDPNLPADEIARRAEIADFHKMNQIRARVDEIVRDPATAEALKPWYRYACKRPTFSDEYLQTFNRPNVTLVDTKGLGVDRITGNGLVCGGAEYEADCVIFATGFNLGANYFGVHGPVITGRGGISLSEYWKTGLKTFHGYSTHGFPNLFRMGMLQNATSFNFVHTLDEQASHLAELIAYAQRTPDALVEPSAEAEAEWVDEIQSGRPANADILAECTPGYYNNEGKPTGVTISYAGGPIEFHERLKRWRANGGMDTMVVK
jgi:cation diffusion facilitator CzcD-associated flavoprotein CzcO